MNEIIENIKSNYAAIQEKIGEAAVKKGVDPGSIKIVGVTKTHPPELIDAGIRAGVKYIGENKVQEAEKKLPMLQERYDEFHYIGHLQKNKINKLLRLKPDLIHSIDKLSTADRLNKASGETGEKQRILIQVNTSEEESKFGVRNDFEELRDLVLRISELEWLEIKGLMTIGLFTDDKKKIRHCFATLRNYYELLKEEKIDRVKMEILSMGMTDDFLIAIEEGANLVRIGTAIFGQRSSH